MSDRVAFLSDAWLSQLAEAVSALPITTPEPAGIGIEVVGLDNAHSPSAPTSTSFSIVARDGRLSAAAGIGSAVGLVVETDADTAARIAHGTENAQIALADGRLRLRGAPDAALVLAEIVGTIGDVFAALRERTDFPANTTAPDAAD